MTISLLSFDIIFFIILITILIRNSESRFEDDHLSSKFGRLVLAQMLSIIGECLFNLALYVNNSIFIKIMTFIMFGSNYALAVFFFRYLITLANLKSKVVNCIIHIIEIIFVLFILLFLINLFTDWILVFHSDRQNKKIVISVFRLIPITLIFLSTVVILISSKTHNLKHKFSIFSYSLFPCIALVFEYISDYFFMNIGFSVAVILIYINIQFDIRKKLLQQENELTRQKVEIMMSQIQPHFLYNSLSAITMLCDSKPAEVKSYISDFSKYLRCNLESLKLTTCIPFEKEMEHVNLYLKFEKLRFEEKLNVEYKISAKDFNLPSLTIQPLVENAVTHGICKRDEGGTVKISTEENQKEYIIKIEDNGVGFDSSILKNEEFKNNNVCLNNIKNRLSTMIFASLKIESRIGEGTVVIIRIPK